MRIKKLTLYTTKLEEELDFYINRLGFQLIEKTVDYFTARIGWSELCFQRTKEEYKYHYCFLIPANKLKQALVWMESRVEIIFIEGNRKIQNFKDWNADSFYFYDASGNLAEFIVRHDLDNGVDADFNISHVLGVNEIGLPTTDIRQTNTQLESELTTKFWKGDLNRFATHGSQEGMFLLVNYLVKKTWFPTTLETKPFPFEAIVENGGKEYKVEFRNQQIKIS